MHTRLIQYKRIASAASADELRELQVEMIDRFGLLPDPARMLFGITGLKLLANPLGVRKLEAGPTSGRIQFNGAPSIDPQHILRLIQSRPRDYKLVGGEKLHFFRNMENTAGRVEQVAAVLSEISGSNAPG